MASLCHDSCLFWYLVHFCKCTLLTQASRKTRFSYISNLSYTFSWKHSLVSLSQPRGKWWCSDEFISVCSWFVSWLKQEKKQSSFYKVLLLLFQEMKQSSCNDDVWSLIFLVSLIIQERKELLTKEWLSAGIGTPLPHTNSNSLTDSPLRTSHLSSLQDRAPPLEGPPPPRLDQTSPYLPWTDPENGGVRASLVTQEIEVEASEASSAPDPKGVGHFSGICVLVYRNTRGMISLPWILSCFLCLLWQW